MLQTTTVNSVLQSISVAPRSYLYATNELPSTQGALSSGVLTSSLSPKPMTPLEASRNFFAESYTVDAQVPISCLVVINSYEQLTRVDFKTNVYRLFYLNSFRHWQWLTISIQIPCSCKYWAATKTAQQDKGRSGKFRLLCHLPSFHIRYSKNSRSFSVKERILTTLQ